MIQFTKPEVKLSYEDSEEIRNIINSGWVCKGKYVKQLEDYFDSYAIACCNATNGLIIALKVLGIQNKYVGIPAFTWPSTLYALECNGNTPIWCDINLDTWTMIYTGLTAHSAEAFIPVDTFGVDSFINTRLPTVYDAAHGFGLNNLGKRGNIEVVSLSFTKITTAMQGGIILTKYKNLYEDIQELVQLSAKMCEVNAYVALKSIEEYNLRMKSYMVSEYNRLITIPFTVQKVPDNWNYSVFSIVLESTEQRDKIADSFIENDIEVKIYYEPLVRGLKNTDDLFSRIIALPLYEEMMHEIPRICEVINESSIY